MELDEYQLLMRTVWPDGGIKSSPISRKVAKNVATTVFTLKLMIFLSPQALSKFLGYFCNQNVCQKLWKVPQSGHAEWGDVFSFSLQKKKRKTFLSQLDLFKGGPEPVWPDWAGALCLIHWLFPIRTNFDKLCQLFLVLNWKCDSCKFHWLGGYLDVANGGSFIPFLS